MKKMKTIKTLLVPLLGSVIVVAIDHLIGVSFKDVGIVAEIIHKATYMAWGAAFVGIIRQ